MKKLLIGIAIFFGIIFLSQLFEPEKPTKGIWSNYAIGCKTQQAFLTWEASQITGNELPLNLVAKRMSKEALEDSNVCEYVMPDLPAAIINSQDPRVWKVRINGKLYWGSPRLVKKLP